MGYKKDIFSSFAYVFELSQNEILADARMKSANADEIFGFASDEIKSTLPPSRRISSNEVGFHRRRRFHPPARVDLVEKPTSRNLSVFLAEKVGFIAHYRGLPHRSAVLSPLHSQSRGGPNESPTRPSPPFESPQNKNKKGTFVPFLFLAEKVGFEPTNGFIRYTISNRAPSTS